VVTGSRIARENIDATVPIISLSAAELLQNGQVNVGDRLALLPPLDLLGTGGDAIFTNTGRFFYGGVQVKF